MKKNKPNYKLDVKFLVVACILAAAVVVVAFICSLGKNNGKGLIISEVMTQNDGAWSAKNASQGFDTPDYVEIYNGTEKTLNLRNFCLSDRSDAAKYLFPELTLQPGEYYVVALGDLTGFSLKKDGGEAVTLSNDAGVMLDQVTTVALEKDQVMMRDASGEWVVSSMPTPGFANTEEGRAAFEASIDYSTQKFELELIISEYLPANKGNFIDDNGELSDFVEVMNITDHEVSLADYFVSGSILNPFDKKLGDVTLAPGESYAAFGVGLVNKTGEVLLSHEDKVITRISYSDLPNGKAMAYETGDWVETGVVSPGFANTAAGIEAFQKSYVTKGQTLVINEVVNSLEEDWVEIYNNGSVAVSLSDYYLSNNKDNFKKYPLGEGVLEPGSYFLFYKNIDLTEDLYLSHEVDGLIDCVFVCDVPAGKSYARGDADGWFYAVPTMGTKNQTAQAYRTISAEPTVSVCGGVYNNVDNIKVQLAAANGAIIYYTTDGSYPTTSSARYTGPIELTKTTVLHAIAVEAGKEPSALLYQSYIINENHTMDVVSVSLDPSEFKNLYNNWTDYELRLQAYVEFYEEDGSFEAPVGISLYGDRARSVKKKAFQLHLDDCWGQDELSYKLFDNREATTYNAFVLRSGSTQGDKEIIRDILGTSMVDDYTDVDVCAYRPVILYVNGEYYGIYNIREKVNRDYIRNHYEVEADDLDIVRIGQIDDYKGAWLINGRGGRFTQEASVGTVDRYNELRTYAKTHDMTTDEAYEYLAARIDMVNFVDYWIAESYVANNDIINCRYFFSSDIDGGKMHAIFYDLDNAMYWAHWDYYTLFLSNEEGFGRYSLGNGQTASCGYENDLIRLLLKNPRFRELWLERLNVQLNTTWKTENVLARLEELVAAYAPEIERDRARWGFSMTKYNSYMNDLRTFIQNRPAYLLSTTQTFFGLTDAQMKEYFDVK